MNDKMNQTLPDGGRPIKVGDPSFIYENVYHPIVWLGEVPYRPRVELLLISDRKKVFLQLLPNNKSGENEKYHYRIPGGSIDPDSDKLQQSINETREEALKDCKNTRDVGVQYYEQYKPGFLDTHQFPIEYAGTINDVFVAEYNGEYPKDKIEPKDLDDDMANNGKFHYITQIVDELRPEHIRAILNSKMVEPYVETILKAALRNPQVGEENITSNRQINFSIPREKSLVGSLPGLVQKTIAMENGIPVIPDNKLYHGTDMKIEVFHPMSLDLGNVDQPPGWSTFCFMDKTLAIRFGLMRAIQRVVKSLSEERVDEKWRALTVKWSLSQQKPFLCKRNFNPVFFLGEKMYVYTFDSSKLKELGVGNDTKLPEITFRDDNVVPDGVDEIEIDKTLLQENIIFCETASDFNTMSQRDDEMVDEYCRGAVAAMVNRDYNENTSVVTELKKAIYTGELKPGDDVMEYMEKNGLDIFEVGYITGFNWEKTVSPLPTMEAVLSSKKKRALMNDDFGLPNARKFPMPDKEHVKLAVKFFNRCKPSEEKELAKNINRKIKEFEMEDEIKVGRTNRFSKYYSTEVAESIVLPLDAMQSVIDYMGEVHPDMAIFINSHINDIIYYQEDDIIPGSLSGVIMVIQTEPQKGRIVIMVPDEAAGFGSENTLLNMFFQDFEALGLKYVQWDIAEEDTTLINLAIQYGFKEIDFLEGYRSFVFSGEYQKVSESICQDGEELYRCSRDTMFGSYAITDVYRMPTFDTVFYSTFQEALRQANYYDDGLYYVWTKDGVRSQDSATLIGTFIGMPSVNGSLTFSEWYFVNTFTKDQINGLVRVADGYQENSRIPPEEFSKVVHEVLSKPIGFAVITEGTDGNIWLNTPTPIMENAGRRGNLFIVSAEDDWDGKNKGPVKTKDAYRALNCYRSIDTALMDCSEDLTGKTLFVYTPDEASKVDLYRPTIVQCPAVTVTGEMWIMNRPKMRIVGAIRVKGKRSTPPRSYLLNGKPASLNEWEWVWIQKATEESIDGSFISGVPVMEAPDDGPTATDYSAEADKASTTEPAGGGGNEEETNNQPQGNQEEDTSANDEDAGGDDELPEDDGSGDMGDDGATDYGAESGDDMMGDEGGDEDTSDDTSTSSDSGSADTNTLVKNYSLIKDYEKMYSLIDDINKTIDSTLRATPVENQVLAQVSRNLTDAKNFITNFLQFHFKNNDYSYNLYYYTVVVQILKLNLKMTEELRIFGEKRGSK